MNFHEYQAKELFAEVGIPVPAGKVARSADEAVDVAKAIGGDFWVVKAQIHAGGRGKAGGVKLCKTLDVGARSGQGHAWHAHGNLPVRWPRPAGGLRAGDPGHQHRQGAVPVGAGGPRHPQSPTSPRPKAAWKSRRPRTTTRTRSRPST
jgi:hypothetical protein